MPEQWISGNRSMDTVRRPLCGCFVLSCMVGGIFRKPLGFRRCLPPARPEKAKPFQAGRSPCTKHPRFSGFAFTNLKKFLRVPRGVFSKTHPWQGVGQSPTERKVKPCSSGHAFAGRSKSFHETPTRLSGFAFTHGEKFLRVPRGVFSKTLLGRGWDRVPQKEIQTLSKGTTIKAGNLTKYLQKPYRTMGEGRKGFCYTVGATKTTKKG